MTIRWVSKRRARPGRAARPFVGQKDRSAKQTTSGTLTVEKACEEYVADLRARKGEDAAKDADGRLKKRLIRCSARSCWPI
jgi:hypothetical protein